MTVSVKLKSGFLQRLVVDAPAEFKRAVAALEEDISGTTAVEKEYVIYGRLMNPDALKRATAVIKQSQSAIKLPKGQVRVRKATEDGVVQHILTAKGFIENGGRDECSMATSEDMYKVFRMITGESMDKTRYTFPTGVKQTNPKGVEVELMWEVDVFHDAQGKDQEWIKIDLEHCEELDALPGFPVIMEDMIFSKKGNYTPEEKAKLAQLYAEVFTNKF